MPITLGTSAIHGASGEALAQAMDRALAALGSGVTIALLIVGLVVGAEALARAWQRREATRGARRRRPKEPRRRGKAAYR